ncbi:protein of unknown function [Streptantibioticus cattleyicolor NRRL 8057 = DSM 46488]|nr:protein of unknown function [Streptantibioticus cattleyicolor NRRL 8057 = DSM 46488]
MPDWLSRRWWGQDAYSGERLVSQARAHTVSEAPGNIGFKTRRSSSIQRRPRTQHASTARRTREYEYEPQ